ncbi:MAG: dTMP kinase [Burkholderiaceae bacterium]|jgi:dTMP kinase
MNPYYKSRFITFEGIDGAGKSTHILQATEWLQRQGHDVINTREPGGTPLGEKLRTLVLNEPMDLRTEALLMFASRQEHIRQVIEPALAAGRWVVCDRFSDATFAYQGAGRGLDWHRLDTLESWVQGDLRPHLTFLFDLDPMVAVQRTKRRAGDCDKFEIESHAFFTRVRQGYLQRAHNEPDRFVRIDAAQPMDRVKQMVLQALATATDRWDVQG